MSDKINSILAERGRQYGDYSEKCEIVMSIRRILPTVHLPDYMRVSIEEIIKKLSRACVGDYTHKDNFDDIAGYATLVSKTLQEIEKCPSQ